MKPLNDCQLESIGYLAIGILEKLFNGHSGQR